MRIPSRARNYETELKFYLNIYVETADGGAFSPICVSRSYQHYCISGPTGDREAGLMGFRLHFPLFFFNFCLSNLFFAMTQLRSIPCVVQECVINRCRMIRREKVLKKLKIETVMCILFFKSSLSLSLSKKKKKKKRTGV